MNDNISYNPLFKLLIDKGLKKGEFAKICGISTPTLAKLSKNKYVSMDVLVKICKEFNCQISDLVEVNIENK